MVEQDRGNRGAPAGRAGTLPWRNDVHTEAITIAVLNGAGKLVIESIIETKASTILQCIQGIAP